MVAHFFGTMFFWTARIVVTLIALACLVNFFKQMAQPLAPRTVIRGGRRIRKGTLDNVLDGAGSALGMCMWLGVAFALWML
jgi:hypothetical protein